MKETFQQPPRSLDADPAITGLVVLDFSLGPEGGLPLIVHGARIQGTAVGSPDIYAPRCIQLITAAARSPDCS